MNDKKKIAKLPLSEDIFLALRLYGADVDSSVELCSRVVALEAEHKWMRREIERVGLALFTGVNGYVGTEDDLRAIGQFVEGVCETMEALVQREERARLELISALQPPAPHPEDLGPVDPADLAQWYASKIKSAVAALAEEEAK